jgi:hypothetical protein
MLRSVWHMTSTEWITNVIFAVGAAILGSLGVRFTSPVFGTIAGFLLFVLIYRLRYKRL